MWDNKGSETAGSYKCFHSQSVSQKVTSIACSARGDCMVVNTPERSLLFRIQQHCQQQQQQLDTAAAVVGYLSCVCVCVLDDSVGCSVQDVMFVADLSAVSVDDNSNNNSNSGGVLKLWKLSINCSLIFPETTRPTMFASPLTAAAMPAAAPTFQLVDMCQCKLINLRDIIDVDNNRQSANVVCINPLYTNVDSYLKGFAYMDNGLPESSVDNSNNSSSSSSSIYSGESDPAGSHLLLSSSTLVENHFSPKHGATVRVSLSRSPSGAGVNQSRVIVPLSPSISNNNSNKNIFNKAVVVSEPTVDVLSERDAVNLDPLKSRLRTWWTDYAARFLFVSDIIVAQDCGLNPTNSEDIAVAFWSSVAHSLGRRSIINFSLKHINNKISPRNHRVESIHFVFCLVKELMDSLGVEYKVALASYWNRKALDFIRASLEEEFGRWFKDGCVLFSEVLRRFQLSPHSGFAIFDNLGKLIDRLTQEYEDEGQGERVASDIRIAVTKLVNSIVCTNSSTDMTGGDIFSVILRDMARFIDMPCEALLRDLSISPEYLLDTFIVGPLSHMERTEPMALAFVFEGLESLPQFYLDSIMDNTVAVDQHVVHNTHLSLPNQSLAVHTTVDDGATSASGMKTEVGVLSLISTILSTSSPWIRIVLSTTTSSSC